MRVHPGSIIINNNSVKNTVPPKHLNKGQVALAKEISPVRGEKKLDEVISHKELTSLASDLKNGLIDRNEAKDRFISMVTHNLIKDKLSDQDKKKMIGYIAEFFSHDPKFLQDLEKNLSNLT